MRKSLFVIYYLFFVICLHSQEQNIDDILNYTLSYRGLTKNDITIPIDFYASAEKSTTNDSKLLLPLVRDMMINPNRSKGWLDSISQLEPHNLQAIVTEMLEMSGYPSNLKIHENNFSNKINDLLGMMEEHYWKTVKREKEILKVFSGDELIFLRKNLFSLLEESDNDDGSNFDIFNYNRQRDSSLATSKKTMDLLSRLGKDKISNAALSNFYFCYELFKYVTKHKDELNRYYDTFRTPNKFGVTIELNDKKIIIGGKENNIYKGDYAFIIDLGGDDIYNIENKNSESGDGFSCIIDLAGNDYYTTSSDFALAGGLFSSGFIFDKEGDDFYESIGNGNLGAAIGDSVCCMTKKETIPIKEFHFQ
jgi:hypothetical protein